MHRVRLSSWLLHKGVWRLGPGGPGDRFEARGDHAITAVRSDFSPGTPLPASVASDSAVRASARRTVEDAGSGAPLTRPDATRWHSPRRSVRSLTFSFPVVPVEWELWERRRRAGSWRLV